MGNVALKFSLFFRGLQTIYILIQEKDSTLGIQNMEPIVFLLSLLY